MVAALGPLVCACGGGAATMPGLDAGAPDSPNGACYAGESGVMPATLVSGIQNPLNLAVDATSIYFDDENGPGGHDVIKRADKGTGANVTVLVDLGFNVAGAFLADGGYLYYRTSDVYRVAVDGSGMPELLAGGYNDLVTHPMILAGDTLFFGALKSGSGVIVSVGVDGSNLVERPIPGTVFGVDADNIYYEAYTPDAGVLGGVQYSVPRAGGTPTVLDDSQHDCDDGVTDARYLYCTGIQPFRVRLGGGGAPTFLCASLEMGVLNGLVLHGSTLYTISGNSGFGQHILGVSIYGSGSYIADGLDNAQSLVADDSALYFVEYDQGAVKTVRLP